jgi:hypothetical protein
MDEFKTKEDIKTKMRRERYVREYICNFAASWDFAHFDFNQGVVTIPCDIEVAHRLANQSWEDVGCTLP